MGLFAIIGIGWVVGFAGYIYLDKKNRYNNLHFYDVRKKVVKFKKLQKDISEQGKGGLF